MNYQENHLRRWLQGHPLISIHALEKEAGLSRDTINHFVNERRGFPDKHYKQLEEILFEYGYRNLNAE